MKSASIALLSILLAPPLFADVGEHLIPAGSLVGCTLSEPRLSSRTTAIGDPVLCQLGVSERYGRSVLPYHSYLVGRFEDYKDPGHFVGKGWMELKFDRMVIEPDTVIPIDARVVDVPGYRVDNQGRILGKGHATRDAVLWSIPILWPLDLVMLPMRGPRPTLKEETRLTLKLMDDMAVPDTQHPQVDPYGLTHRPSAEYMPPPGPNPDAEPAPEMSYAPPPPDDQQQQQAYDNTPPPPAMDYSAPPPMAYAPPPPVMIAPPPVMAYGYGAYGYGAAIVVGRGPALAYGPRYYAGGPRAYGYGYAPRGYGYGAGPRGAYGYAPRGNGYAGGGRNYAYGASRGGQGYARGGYSARGGSGRGARGSGR
jgi:hypothetical protein